MSKVNRPLAIGGAAVICMFLSSSLLLGAPEPTLGLQNLNFKPPVPTYIAQVHGSSRTDLYKKLGVEQPVVQQPVVVAAETPVAAQVPEELKKAKKAEVSAKAAAAKAKPAKVQVASRGGNPTAPANPGIVSYALSLTGIPYRFGGTTPAGFDCSGFTGYVFAKNGIKLPRTSYQQINVGDAVSKSNLQPGDLVFFSTYSKGASHVGIYIGNGQFVHASNSGTRTTSLNDSYYAGRFVGARRVSK